MNFDNTFNAIIVLFEMMTTEGWMRPMFNGIDNNGVGKQPIENNNFFNALFFCGFMIVGSIFLLNLFVGVIIDNFNKIKD